MQNFQETFETRNHVNALSAVFFNLHDCTFNYNIHDNQSKRSLTNKTLKEAATIGVL